MGERSTCLDPFIYSVVYSKEQNFKTSSFTDPVHGAADDVTIDAPEISSSFCVV